MRAKWEQEGVSGPKEEKEVRPRQLGEMGMDEQDLTMDMANEGPLTTCQSWGFVMADWGREEDRGPWKEAKEHPGILAVPLVGPSAPRGTKPD